MEFKDFERVDCKFSIPARPTVRQQLSYFGAASGSDKSDTFIRYWEGAKQLIQKWDCKTLAQNADLDTLTDPSQTEIILWVGLEVFKAMNGLEDIPKN